MATKFSQTRSGPLAAVLVAGLALLVGGLGFFVWPTVWRYDQVKMQAGTFPVRIHRVTDRAEILLGPRGWVLAAEHVGHTDNKVVGSAVVR